ncbi:MAG: hypothetical protein ACJ71K_21005 [Nitrososphaeraceae archaeon]
MISDYWIRFEVTEEMLHAFQCMIGEAEVYIKVTIECMATGELPLDYNLTAARYQLKNLKEIHRVLEVKYLMQKQKSLQ